jgi:hypothetical protein
VTYEFGGPEYERHLRAFDRNSLLNPRFKYPIVFHILIPMLYERYDVDLYLFRCWSRSVRPFFHSGPIKTGVVT